MANANRTPNRDACAREWLDRLLAGQFYPQAQELDEFVTVCGDDEGLHHEFKPGADPASGSGADPAAVLRRYIAGFANSDGGFVVFGYSQRGRTFDGFRPPGGAKAQEWATRALQPLATYLSPPARIRVVPHPGAAAGADVLIVAVHRAPALVPVIIAGKPVFYIRMGDSTVQVPSYNTIGAPDYLIADVLLGRRQRPVIVPSRPTLTLGLERKQWLGPAVTAHEAMIRIRLENEGVVYADAVAAGLVAWSLDNKRFPKPPKPRPTRSSVPDFPYGLPPPMPVMPVMAYDPFRIDPKDLPRSLAPFVELSLPECITREQWTAPWATVHAPAWSGAKELDLAPFETTELEFGPFLWPVFQCTDGSAPPDDEDARGHWAMRRGRLRMSAALYVTTRNSQPHWFSVTVRYGEDALPQDPGEIKGPSRRANLDLFASDAERVAVAVEVDRGD